MTPPRILQVGFPFGNPVYIAAACTVVAVTGEPIIVEATIVVRSVLPPPEHITRHAVDTILTDRAANRPLLPKEQRGTNSSPAPSILRIRRLRFGRPRNQSSFLHLVLSSVAFGI